MAVAATAKEDGSQIGRLDQGLGSYFEPNEDLFSASTLASKDERILIHSH